MKTYYLDAYGFRYEREMTQEEINRKRILANVDGVPVSAGYMHYLYPLLPLCKEVEWK
jgi:hypothetical protein